MIEQTVATEAKPTAEVSQTTKPSPIANPVNDLVDKVSKWARPYGPKNYQTFVFIVVLGLWLLALYFFISLIEINNDGSRLGELGDSFGLLNTLFSGLAFAAVIVTIIQQQKQAHEDRQLTSQQMFEAAFFEMNRIAREAKASIRLTRPKDKVYLGVDAANNLRDQVVEEMNNRHRDWNRNIFLLQQEEKPSVWHGTIFSKEDIHKAFEASIGRLAIMSEFNGFFALVSAELKFLETRPIAASRQKDKEVYDRLLEVVRASLDSSTLAIMLLRGIGSEDIMEMIDKYDLARHMNKGEVWKLCKPHYSSLRNVDEEA